MINAVLVVELEAITHLRKFKEDVVLKVNSEVTTRKDEIGKAINKKAEDYKNKEFGQPVSPTNRGNYNNG